MAKTEHIEPEAFGYCWHRSNGEYYYGIRKGQIDGWYAGSGKVFVSKFGGRSRKSCNHPEQWHRTIEFRGTYSECLSWEKEMVSSEMVSNSLCLNVKPGGHGLTGFTHSEETKAKIRKALLGKKRPASVGEAVRKANIGKKLSEEHKQKIGKASQAMWNKRKGNV